MALVDAGLDPAGGISQRSCLRHGRKVGKQPPPGGAQVAAGSLTRPRSPSRARLTWKRARGRHFSAMRCASHEPKRRNTMTKASHSPDQAAEAGKPQAARPEWVNARRIVVKIGSSLL